MQFKLPYFKYMFEIRYKQKNRCSTFHPIKAKCSNVIEIPKTEPAARLAVGEKNPKKYLQQRHVFPVDRFM